MKRDAAHYLLKEVYDELLKTHPSLKFGTYRDGGSVSYSIPTDGYDNIVLLAPIRSVKLEGNRLDTYIEYAATLKEGCVRFEDIYRKENVLESVTLEDRPYMLPNRVFDRDGVKRDIIKIVNNRLAGTLADKHKKQRNYPL